MSNDKQWITVPEAAARSGYSVRTLQRLLQAGAIDGWKPGHDWLTTLDAVMTYKRQVKRGRPKKSDQST